MGHYKEEQWYKDLSKALESFTEESLKEIGNQKTKAYHNAKVLGEKNKKSGVLSKRGSKGGNNSSWTKDSKNQSLAGKERAKKGGKEQLASVRTFESRSKGGKTSGSNNVESGHWKNCQQEALKIVTQPTTCPHCGLTSNYNIIKGKHLDGKCKWLKIDKSRIIELGLMGVKYNKISEELGVKEWIVKNVMREYKKSLTHG